MTMTLLTSREQEIASLASTGLSNKGIARRLELSEGTVKVHLHNIFQKTGVSNRTALVALMQVPTAVTNSVCPWETTQGPLRICCPELPLLPNTKRASRNNADATRL